MCLLSAIAVFVTIGVSAFGTASAQTANDVFGGVLSEVLKGKSPQQFFQGWLTDKLTKALTKSEGAMVGDKRLANGGQALSLNASEQQRANIAFAHFNRTNATAPEIAPSVEVYQAGTVAGKASMAKLQRVGSKYETASTLTPAAEAEIRNALQPFTLEYLIQKGQTEGGGAVVVAPHSIQSFTFSGYCSDPRLPAPSAGEAFQLVPTSTLFPSEFQGALNGLLRIGAQSGIGRNSAIQGLIWSLRRTANGEDIGKSLELSPEQQQLLDRADPNATSALQSYYAKAQGQRLIQDAIRSGVRTALPASGSSRSISSISNSSALNEIRALSALIDQNRATGAVRGQNAAYTQLNEHVSALATSQSGGMNQVNIDIANDGDTATVFMPGSCVAQSTRPAQRLVMHTSSNEFQSSNVNLRPRSAVANALPWSYASLNPSTANYRSAAYWRMQSSFGERAPAPYVVQAQFVQALQVGAGGVVAFCRFRPEACARIGLGFLTAAGAATLPRPSDQALPPSAKVLETMLEESVSVCSAAATEQQEDRSNQVKVYRVYGGRGKAGLFSVDDATGGTFFSRDDPRLLGSVEAIRQAYAILPRWNDVSLVAEGYIKLKDISYSGPAESKVDPDTGRIYVGGGVELRVINAKSKLSLERKDIPLRLK